MNSSYGEWEKKYKFNSVAQSCLTLCDPVDCSTPGFPVHHQPLELAQTLVHWVGDAIQPHHPLSFPFISYLQSFPALVFSNESVLCIRWPKYWSFSFSISPSNEYSGLIPLGFTGSITLQPKGFSQVFFNTTVQKHQSRTRPSFPHSQFVPLGSFHEPLIHQRADRMKTTIIDN